MEAAKRKFKPIKSFFGNLLPEHITEDLCRQYEGHRAKMPATVRNELAVLRSAINWHDPNNKAIFWFPPAPSPKDNYLTKEEAAQLLSAARSEHIKLFIVLALMTGGRTTALLELKWNRVDFERGFVDLRTEENSRKKRALLPMNDTLRAALLSAHQARTCDYVIEYGSRKVKSVFKGFAQTAKNAGVNASPHVLRHTAAVWMAEAGVPMSEISQFLGHSSTGITERVYARYSPTYLGKAASALNF